MSDSLIIRTVPPVQESFSRSLYSGVWVKQVNNFVRVLSDQDWMHLTERGQPILFLANTGPFFKFCIGQDWMHLRQKTASYYILAKY